MQPSLKIAAGLLTCAAMCLSSPVAGQAQAPSSVRKVQILPNQNLVEIEIEASDRLLPQTQMLTGPDRLVVDFANAVPGAQLRNQNVNRGEVKNVRVGLFSSKPPVTRVVLDLNGPQRYQVFPNGRTVIVKVGGTGGSEAALRPATSERAAGFGLVNTTYPVQAVRIDPPAPPPVKAPLTVLFHDGQLTINSSNANLSEVLFAVHQRTGADIPIPAGAEQEQVRGDLGPAPAAEVLAHLLNGTRFNFLILSSSNKPGALDRVILTPRNDALMPMAPIAAPSQARAMLQSSNDDADSEPQSAGPPPVPIPPQAVPPEAKVPQSSDVPD